MCGLGEKPLMYGMPGVPVGRKRAGKRQTWMPIRRFIDVWTWGGGWLQDEACQVNVLRVLRF